ncbi:DELTA-alicitoxin-Pse2b-like [Selaginella moellendorffii]|uniref:DELTA-alicitoxin-Pse2b-like n=1 Tax=Selaginella moellendorffii TaxID=88036 RepID=UPI000D1C8F19|nr:DELTA-alicitoxin-Pse2b-like [Selaginella moellendorffii]XP_024521312.1 DELTA-alicitoxin-Pse2b-like [Selaginella moellendorffii]|eukprot:XP_024521311.1 DELTA-alicitoxin-Pse2b-like [Selaginella moellendorffii]
MHSLQCHCVATNQFSRYHELAALFFLFCILAFFASSKSAETPIPKGGLLVLVQPNNVLLDALDNRGLEWSTVNKTDMSVSLSKATTVPQQGGLVLSAGELLQLLGEQEGSLGTGVYLPRANILETQAGGLNIFSNLNEDAVIILDVNKVDYQTSFYESTERFYMSLGAEASISGNYQAVSATLQSTFNSISAGEQEISALSLDAVSISKMKTLNSNKVDHLPLNPKFFEELQTLPVEVAEPGVSSSWTPFQQFLSKWGSHYISTIYTGSLLQQWSSAKSSKSYSQQQFKAQACLKLEGLQSGVEGCAGVSQESKRESANLEMHNKLFVKGGTPETRAKLTQDRSKELMFTFMEEGATSSLAVQYKFTPIWEVVLRRFPVGSSQWQVGRNLQAYYQGYWGFQCLTKSTPRGSVILQQFVAVKDISGDSKHFECHRACEGCKNDDDCHVGGIGFTCYCYGDSCIVLDSNGRATTRTTSQGGTWDGVNNSCKYDSASCSCKGYDDDKDCRGGWVVMWNQAEAVADAPTSIVAAAGGDVNMSVNACSCPT